MGFGDDSGWQKEWLMGLLGSARSPPHCWGLPAHHQTADEKLLEEVVSK
jgi:hypothetical protein